MNAVPLTAGRSHEAKRRLGWIMMGLAPVTLVAAVGVVVFSGGLAATTREVFIARLLASAAAVLFAVGYSVVLLAHLRDRDHATVIGFTLIVVCAVSAAALLTAWQLLFVNDTVASGVRIALSVLVLTGAIGTVLAPIARRLTSG